LAQGPNQGKGEDVLLLVGPAAALAMSRGPEFGRPRTAESIAASSPALAHGASARVKTYPPVLAKNDPGNL
jgi:hypothetical protein